MKSVVYLEAKVDRFQSRIKSASAAFVLSVANTFRDHRFLPC
jgi:hypothetical protein